MQVIQLASSQAHRAGLNRLGFRSATPLGNFEHREIRGRAVEVIICETVGSMRNFVVGLVLAAVPGTGRGINQ